MEPWLSWAIVLGAAAVAYWYYKPVQRAQTARSRSNTGTEIPQVTRPTKKEERARRKPSSASSSDYGGKLTPVVSAIKDITASATDAVPLKKSKLKLDEDDSGSEKQWAEQLVKARKGTNLTVPSRDTGRTKSGRVSSNTGSDISSLSGADADDDLTPATSPALKAGDVSDMLEPKQAAPSVLRLTEPSNPVPQRAPRPQKEFQVAETKKQRQNRKKNEEKRAANEEIEKERQALLERQRRAAREARGEPAKNGLQPSKAPTKNAWKDNASPNKTEGAPPTLPLLDTFDRAAPPVIGNAQASVMPSQSTYGHHEYTNGMTEEEQVTLASKISEDEDGWNTVATKKAKKQPSFSEGSTPKPSQSNKASGGSTVANGFASLQEED